MSIKVEDLTYIYQAGTAMESYALKHISFETADGEFIGLIGHTGSGKSTLIQHLNGLIRATEGHIYYNGEDIYSQGFSMKKLRQKVGLVFQYPEYQLFEETVAKDIAFGPKNLGLDEEEINRRVREAMDLVRLDYDKFAEKSPFDLSGGQKRRVAIAGVIAMKPEVLILDEPTAGLDPKAHRDVLEMIVDIHRREKNVTVFVSHNMNDVARLCDKVLVMNGGKCVLQGTPKDVFAEADMLRSMGLDLPDVTQMLYELKQKGVEMPDGVFDIDEAEKLILDYIRGGKSVD